MLKRVLHRAMCLLTAAAVMLPLPAAAAPAAQAGDVISISSPAQLIELAKSCTLDTWSQGKTVRLNADLDLTGLDFAPIPTFGGTFLGNNHTISGLSVTGDGSHQGLFRYIQPGGTVQNLTVRGTVAPGGSAECVGGIAGRNYGTLSRCTFVGTVKGSADVGGLVGVNEGGGRVSACTSFAAVSGKLRTGGIAGRNAGTLISCVSRGSVNTALADQDFTLEDLETGNVLEELEGSAGRPGTADIAADDQEDTGGIAGYSSGIIQSCSNTGIVGYVHVGYNVGGIAGRQTGYLSGCTNSGHILGRKDVGGIAGQSEPDILITDSDTLENIRASLDHLSDLIDQAISHADRSADDISSRLSTIGAQADNARDHTQELLERTEDLLNENIDAVNDLSVAVTGALDRISPAMDDLSDAVGQFSDLMDALEPVMDDLADASGSGSQLADHLDRAMSDLKAALGQADGALSQIQNALDRLRDAVLDGDTAETARALADLSGGVSSLTDALGGAAEAQSRLGAVDSGALGAVQQENLALAQALGDLGGAAGQLSGAVSSLQDNFSPDFDSLSGALRDLADAMDAISSSFGGLRSALEQLRRAANDAERMGGSLQSAFQRLADLSGDASGIADLLSVSVDKIKDAVDYLRETGAITLTPIGDDYRAAGDQLFDDLSGVSTAMGDLNDTVSAASDTLTADLRAINRQFTSLMELVLDALTDLQDDVDDGFSDRVRDTSEENAAALTQGKVELCTNSGLIEGDRNVGGILGSMAVEYERNPEDDDSLNLSLGATYETKAAVLSCVNQGKVTGKKDCVGGVVGRMDLGFLSGCQNYGDAESTGGSYVGGIAGQTEASVQKSYAKCSLSGKSYVGGIAGCGGTLRHCAAICLISDAEECSGAVAGYADDLDCLTENYYVDTGLGAVDNISYAGHAQGAELSFLQNMEGTPAEFTAFQLILRAEDRVIQTIPFLFGQRLSRLKLPSPPEKEGYFGVWPTPADDTPRSDVILDAEYSPWLTMVASRQADGDRSLALADGQFTSQAVLSVTDGTRPAPAGAPADARVWEISLTGTDLGEDVILPLRLLCPGGGSVRVYRDGAWQDLESQVNGSYLIVEMHGTSETFCVEPDGAVPAILLAIILAAALAAVLLLVLIRKRSKKRRAAAASRPAETETSEKESAGKR